LHCSYEELLNAGDCHCAGTPWCVDGFMAQSTKRYHTGRLDCIDNLEHASTTATKVVEAAEQLELLDHLELFFKDAWDHIPPPPPLSRKKSGGGPADQASATPASSALTELLGSLTRTRHELEQIDLRHSEASAAASLVSTSFNDRKARNHPQSMYFVFFGGFCCSLFF
jgi:hypothetical protein